MTSHTHQHSFATHLLELLAHACVETTTTYCHVLNPGGGGQPARSAPAGSRFEFAG